MLRMRRSWRCSSTICRRFQLARSACILVAADKRLLRSADAEGLKTLDPEALSVNDVPAFLSSL